MNELREYKVTLANGLEVTENAESDEQAALIAREHFGAVAKVEATGQIVGELSGGAVIPGPDSEFEPAPPASETTAPAAGGFDAIPAAPDTRDWAAIQADYRNLNASEFESKYPNWYSDSDFRERLSRNA